MEQQETIAVTNDAEQPSSEQTRVERLVRHVLSNVVSGVAKLDDAPSSAGTHFDSAISALANATNWRPDDHELQTIILDAIEHMRVYGK